MALIKKALPEATDEEIITCLEKRGYHFEGELSNVDDLVGLDWMVEMFDKGFSEQLGKDIASAKGEKLAHSTFVEDLMKFKVLGA
eukprot:6634905-Pyramimonas_sp.AAC.1